MQGPHQVGLTHWWCEVQTKTTPQPSRGRRRRKSVGPADLYLAGRFCSQVTETQLKLALMLQETGMFREEVASGTAAAGVAS